jgi:hypothetical protein
VRVQVGLQYSQNDMEVASIKGIVSTLLHAKMKAVQVIFVIMFIY